MSIEPTSVSNPVVRENENSSKRSVWNETQGSGTGSKDGQFSSFWDKAFVGAQKLFGIELASKHKSDRIEDASNGNDDQFDAGEKRIEEKRLDTVAGFGNSSFPRRFVSVRQDQPASYDFLSPTDKSLSRSPGTSEIDNDRNTDRIRERREEGESVRDLDEDSDEDSEAEPNRVKTADPPVLAPPPFANNALKRAKDNVLPTDIQQVAITKDSIGINSAKQDAIMSAKINTQSIEGTAQEELSPLKMLDEVSMGGIRRVSGENANGAEGSSSSDAGLGEDKEGVGSLKAIVATPNLGDVKQAVASSRGDLGQSSHENGRDSLTIDADKAKRNLLSQFDNLKPMGSQKGANAVSSNLTQSQTSSSLTAAGEVASEREGSTDVTGKSADTSRAPALKNPTSIPVRQDSGRALSNPSNSVEVAGSAPNQARRVDVQATPNANRSARSTESRTSIGKPIGTNPVSSVNSAANAVGATPVSGNSVSRDPVIDPVAKALLNSETDTGSKTAKTSGVSGMSAKVESSQGIQLNGSESSSSNKSNFVAKAQPSSYATKSAEETREIYATLSKSIDRLVSAKSDVVSIRINFDQGGSMALRVSMDTGQVNTAMQTDLPGLESLIKASWSEFASESNHKGLKLNLPQFSQLDSENGKNENLMGFEQRGGQSKGESSSPSRANGSRRSAPSDRQTTDTSSPDSAESDSDSEQELKTYA